MHGENHPPSFYTHIYILFALFAINKQINKKKIDVLDNP